MLRRECYCIFMDIVYYYSRLIYYLKVPRYRQSALSHRIFSVAGPELDMDRVHPRVGSGRVHFCGSPWITQNVTLSVIVKFTQFGESLVLLSYFLYKLNIHE